MPGMIDNKARQCLSAGPGESPERWRQSGFAEFFLSLAPQRYGLVGCVQRNVRHQWHRSQARIGADES